MSVTGIICEYNPFHRGHQKQIAQLKAQGHTVVCLMSGNFVQRGHPAIFDKMLRAKAAIGCGADLVIELPITYAVSSAEGFAAGGVEILSKLCDNLCFGAETADKASLLAAAGALLSDTFTDRLRVHLDKGLSFPAARAAALAEIGIDTALVETPNNILAVEYCKAIMAQKSSLTPLPIFRAGSYHDTTVNDENPSATALRILIQNGQNWEDFVPKQAHFTPEAAPIHAIEYGEKALLAKLRTMTDAEFEALPFSSEGLWRKLMHASRRCATLEEIIAATKSKRYTRTRIDRMILCAFLSITKDMLSSPAPYARVLAFNDRGRAILSEAKSSRYFINIGEKTGHTYEALEHRAGALYELFSQNPGKPDTEGNYRVFYLKDGVKNVE